MQKFYITTPIYYVNDEPHIGHAYTTLAADVIARFKRLSGFDVWFLTGTDEHGQKIEKAAANSRIDTQEFVDNFSNNFRKLFKVLNISNDDFIRTTEARHKEFVSKIWQHMLNKGYIYLSKYSGWYAVRDEAFYQENELVDGIAPTGASVEWVEEDSYFFKLSAFENDLLNFYEHNPDFIMPTNRRNEVLSFVKSGLKDLSISRTSFSWGIKVSGDEKHVIYVWLDALFNYISALDNEDKIEYWPCDLHLIGKDILRFHAIYWPAFLMASDLELPKRIFAHGWWTNEGVKISKSLGNTIDPFSLVSDFGLDYVRYFLMRAITFGNDGNYSRQGLITLINAELVNNIGNLVQRVTAFVHKYCNSIIPKYGDFNLDDNELLDLSVVLFQKFQNCFDKQSIDLAIGSVIELSTAANRYIDLNAPWNLRKTDEERMNTVLYILLEVIKRIGIMLQPFIPDSAAIILNALGVTHKLLSDIFILIQPGNSISIREHVFPRLN